MDIPALTVNPVPAVIAPVAVIVVPETAPVVVISPDLASKLPEVTVNPVPAVTAPVAIILPDTSNA